jgi:guanylate kinase|tara:strand:+ start:536 stop:1165 length:630 start_codon:yes stop_codon:yes gene_type:complete
MSNDKGQLIVISAPSGAGKTSIIKNVIKKLNDRNSESKFSVSHTTRLPRDGDIDGSDYYFVSNERFAELFEAGNFIETAEVHDYKYGTSKDFIDENIYKGINVFLEIDVQGFQKLRSKDVEFRSVFILPPSIEELRGRIEKRGLDSEDVIEKRMKNALKELGEAEKYDYLVINDVFDQAVDELLEIVITKGFKDYSHDKKLKILQDLLS